MIPRPDQAQKASILCIEDEEDLRLDLVEELHDAGYRVSSATSGESGLALLAEAAYALVICDVRLPGISGLEVLTRIRADPLRCKTPVIILSAYDDAELHRRLGSGAASVFRAKPIDYQDLLNQVAILTARSAKPENR